MRKNVCSKFTDDVYRKIYSLVDENAAITLVNIKEVLSNDCGIYFSLSCISKHLKKIMFSTKQLTVCLADRNSNSVKAARKRYCKEQLEDTRRLEKIFIDECGFNFHLHRTRGRSIVGPNAVITMRTQRGLN